MLMNFNNGKGVPTPPHDKRKKKKRKRISLLSSMYTKIGYALLIIYNILNFPEFSSHLSTQKLI